MPLDRFKEGARGIGEGYFGVEVSTLGRAQGL